MILMMTILHIFQNLIKSIAEESIPKTSSNKKHNKSWFWLNLV